MINRIFIVTNNSEHTASVNDNVFLCRRINPANNQELSNTYRLLSESAITQSILVEINSPLNKEQVTDIVSFLFIPSLAKISGKYLLNIFNNTGDKQEHSISLLREAIKEQGFENVIVNSIPGEKIISSKSNFVENYKSVLQSEIFFGNNLFFECSETSEIEILIAAVKEIESSFRKENTRLYSLAQENMKLEEEKILLEEKNKSIGNELSNQKEYADILRASHSTRQLQDYYTNEYEVLPTWFKRFGHIVKVVTGKRRLKSLFDENEKKQ